MQKVNVAEKLSRIDKHWQPKIAGELNGQHVKLVKFQGSFVWHSHEAEDEMFFVIRGSFRMEWKDGNGSVQTTELGPGEFLIVPRGTEHRPVADDEVEVMLFEPASTLNTGNVRDALTVDAPERI